MCMILTLCYTRAISLLFIHGNLTEIICNHFEFRGIALNSVLNLSPIISVSLLLTLYDLNYFFHPLSK